MPTLRPLLPIRNAIARVRIAWLNRFWGMHIDPTVLLSFSAKMDKTWPKGVHIGPHTIVTFGVAVLAHDMSRNLRTNTRIGRNCFIGARSIILPGVTIGDGSIVAAGSVVNRDVPPGSIVAGNPAKVVKSGIDTVEYGVLAEFHYPRPPQG